MIKNYYARNSHGEKCFCKIEQLKTGVVAVSFYLPKAGFSIKYSYDHPLARISCVRTTYDNRKTIVRYLLHPVLWTGHSFDQGSKYFDYHGVIDDLFDGWIKIIKYDENKKPMHY